MTTKSKIRTPLAAVLAALLGSAILICLWWELGRKGLQADANGTAGSTGPLELIMAVLGVGLLAGSVVCWVMHRRQSRQP